MGQPSNGGDNLFSVLKWPVTVIVCLIAVYLAQYLFGIDFTRVKKIAPKEIEFYEPKEPQIGNLDFRKPEDSSKEGITFNYLIQEFNRKKEKNLKFQFYKSKKELIHSFFTEDAEVVINGEAGYTVQDCFINAINSNHSLKVQKQLLSEDQIELLILGTF